MKKDNASNAPPGFTWKEIHASRSKDQDVCKVKANSAPTVLLGSTTLMVVVFQSSISALNMLKMEHAPNANLDTQYWEDSAQRLFLLNLVKIVRSRINTDVLNVKMDSISHNKELVKVSNLDACNTGENLVKSVSQVSSFSMESVSSKVVNNTLLQDVFSAPHLMFWLEADANFPTALSPWTVNVSSVLVTTESRMDNVFNLWKTDATHVPKDTLFLQMENVSKISPDVKITINMDHVFNAQEALSLATESAPSLDVTDLETMDVWLVLLLSNWSMEDVLFLTATKLISQQKHARFVLQVSISKTEFVLRTILCA